MRSNAALRDLLGDRFPEPEAKRQRMSEDEAPIRPTPSPFVTVTPSKAKSRSFSETISIPKLAPSPTLKEGRRAQDDHNNVISVETPTPKKQEPLGLHLHVPSRKDAPPTSPVQTGARAPPVSPKTDLSASPMSVLPRHSRGIEFARAATHLHHSTLAEQSSPDSSPAIAQRAMNIPRARRKSVNAMMVDGPFFERGQTGISSSLGSINMLASDYTDSSSDDDLEPNDMEEQEDIILGTPNLHRKSPSAVIGLGAMNPWGTLHMGNSNNFLGFRKPRFADGRSRNSSSSASGNSNLASPVPTSPSGTSKIGEGGYFGGAMRPRKPSSRRESISKVTNELHISSGNDSGDEAGFPMPSTPGVIRRPVTRRTNMLPKTRAFGRIRAELLEEAAPVEAEVKREAEVIRQVLESDEPHGQKTGYISPSLQPLQGLEGIPEDEIPEDGTMTLDNTTPPVSATTSTSTSSIANNIFGTFGRQNSTATTNSGSMMSLGGGKEFWDNIDQNMTPPPAGFNLRGNGRSASEDMTMDSPTVNTASGSVFGLSMSNNGSGSANFSSESRASTPQPTQAQGQNTMQQPPTAADGLRKNNKRRRDDDLDLSWVKRRAVSPGVSVQNSPILAQSPVQRSGDSWGSLQGQNQSRVSREGSIVGGTGDLKRSNSVSSVVNGTPSLGPKRIGLQGMSDMQGLTEKMTLE